MREPERATSLDRLEDLLGHPWFLPGLTGVIFAGVVTLVMILLGRIIFPMILVGGAAGAAFGWILPFEHRRLVSRRHRNLERLAAKGDVAACRQAGLLYQSGSGDRGRSLDAARKFFQMGAGLGDPESMLLLADLMFWGLGGVKDQDSARQWAERAHGLAPGLALPSWVHEPSAAPAPDLPRRYVRG